MSDPELDPEANTEPLEICEEVFEMGSLLQGSFERAQFCRWVFEDSLKWKMLAQMDRCVSVETLRLLHDFVCEGMPSDALTLWRQEVADFCVPAGFESGKEISSPIVGVEFYFFGKPEDGRLVVLRRHEGKEGDKIVHLIRVDCSNWYDLGNAEFNFVQEWMIFDDLASKSGEPVLKEGGFAPCEGMDRDFLYYVVAEAIKQLDRGGERNLSDISVLRKVWRQELEIMVAEKTSMEKFVLERNLVKTALFAVFLGVSVGAVWRHFGLDGRCDGVGIVEDGVDSLIDGFNSLE
jgi:hypothetical protein